MKFASRNQMRLSWQTEENLYQKKIAAFLRRSLISGKEKKNKVEETCLCSQYWLSDSIINDINNNLHIKANEELSQVVIDPPTFR